MKTQRCRNCGELTKNLFKGLCYLCIDYINENDIKKIKHRIKEKSCWLCGQEDCDCDDEEEG